MYFKLSVKNSVRQWCTLVKFAEVDAISENNRIYKWQFDVSMIACLSRGYSYSLSDIGINCHCLDIKFSNIFTDLSHLKLYLSLCLLLCVCVCVCVCARARARVRACFFFLLFFFLFYFIEHAPLQYSNTTCLCTLLIPYGI